MVEDMDLERQSTSRQALLALITKKEKLEQDISQMKEILDINSIGLNEPLVDADGFPREDIDVYQVRHARHKIICLQNDHKALMREIEAGLHELSAFNRQNPDGAEAMDQSTIERNTQNLGPIARVNLVHPNSPAALAGLEVGDFILQFGTVTEENFSSLKDIGAVVEHSVNRKVALTVQRDDVNHRLSLVPQPWSGKGLLGCNILPIESIDR